MGPFEWFGLLFDSTGDWLCVARNKGKKEKTKSEVDRRLVYDQMLYNEDESSRVPTERKLEVINQVRAEEGLDPLELPSKTSKKSK